MFFVFLLTNLITSCFNSCQEDNLEDADRQRQVYMNEVSLWTHTTVELKWKVLNYIILSKVYSLYDDQPKKERYEIDTTYVNG